MRSRNWCIVVGMAVASIAISTKVLATDPDGVTTPTFTGNPSGTPYAWSGSTPMDGVGVMVHDGRMRYGLSVAHAEGVNLPFSLHLSYDSASLHDGYEGVGWFSLLDTQVSEDPSGNVTILMEDGVARTWTKSGSTYTRPAGVLDDLSKSGSVYTRKHPLGLQYVYGTKLNSIQDRFGNTISFAYDGSNQPTSITDTRGETHTITLWPGTGRLKQITAADGRAWVFKYDGNANLVEIDGPATASFTSGIVLQYQYSSGSSTAALNHNLTGAVDGRGNTWMTVTYDSSDRVIAQTLAGDAITFGYDDAANHRTVVTDRAGNVREWKWDPNTFAKQQLLQRTNRGVRAGEGDYTTTWVGDADGYIKKVIFPRGNGIKWTLNAAKLVTEARRKTDMTAADSSTDDIIETFTFDSTKNYAISAHTDAAGNTTSYTLDSYGQPTTVTLPTITSTTPNVTITNQFSYNSNGTIASSTDGEGKVTSYSYYTSGAKKGRLQTLTRDVGTGHLNIATSYDYNGFGAVTSVTDPRGYTTTYSVEAYGNVTEIDAPSSLGYVTKLSYDGNLNVVKRQVKNIDANGTAQSNPAWWETNIAYTTMDKVSSVTEYVSSSHNRVTSYTYDDNDQVASVSCDGRVSSNTYDERGLLYRMARDPSGINTTTTFSYDANGNPAEIVDPRGKTTTLTHDLFDRRTRTTDPLGHYQDFILDKRGNVTEQKWTQHGATDVLLAHRKASFNEVGWGYQQQDLLKGTTDTWLTRSYGFDKRGLLTQATDRRGNSMSYAYDGAGRTSSITDPAGNIQEFTRDAGGNVTAAYNTEVVPGSSSTETYETDAIYDALGRMTSQTMKDRTNTSNTKVTSWALDSRSLPSTVTDPMGFATIYAYDGLGRMTQKTSPIASSTTAVTQYQFDDNNNVTQTTDPNGKTTSFAYDNLNRVTTTTYADSTTFATAYDAASNVTQWTDQNGTVVSQTFDDNGRLTARSANLATGVGGVTWESYAYDGLGRLKEARNNGSTVQYTFDSLSRMKTEVEGANPLGSTGKTVQYSWDEESGISQIVYPAGFIANHTRDADDRTTEIKDGSNNRVVAYSLYGADQRTMSVSYGNGTHTDASYDGFARLTTVTDYTSSNAVFAGFNYGYDKNDNLLYEARTHQSGHGEVYSYDQSGRMTTAKSDVVNPAAEAATPGSSTYAVNAGYNIDGLANRTSVVSTPYGGSSTTTSYTVNSVNTYTAVGSQSMTYFANGNLKDDGTNTYKYDFHNRLIEVTRKSDGAVIASYQYDAIENGRRWLATENGVTTRYVFDPGMAIEEYNYETGDLLRSVVFGQHEKPVMIASGSSRYYLHSRGDGSITHVTDGSQNIVETYEYGHFGETTIKNSSGTVVTSTQIGNSVVAQFDG